MQSWSDSSHIWRSDGILLFVAGLVVEVGLLVRASRTGKRHGATLAELTGAVKAVERRVKGLERTDEEARAVGGAR